MSPNRTRHCPLSESGGQAAVELIATLPALLLVALLLFQLGATGYTYTLTDGAAEAGALALAADRSPGAAVRAALPGWARQRVEIKTAPTRVEVTVRPPSPLGFIAEHLRVRSSAAIAAGGIRSSP